MAKASKPIGYYDGVGQQIQRNAPRGRLARAVILVSMATPAHSAIDSMNLGAKYNANKTAISFRVQETQNDANDVTPNSDANQNYWGYMTEDYFAPDRRYSSNASEGSSRHVQPEAAPGSTQRRERQQQLLEQWQ